VQNIIYTPANIRVEISGRSFFDKYKGQITTILQKHLGQVSNISYKEGSYNEFYVA